MTKQDKKLREEIKKEFDARFNNETYQLWKENRKMEAETTCDEEVWYFIEDKILSKVKEEIMGELPKEKSEAGQLHPDINIQAEGYNQALKQVQEILNRTL